MRAIGRIVATIGCFGVFVLSGPTATAGAHTWDVWEVFSNCDGTIQFIELKEANGTPGEIGLGGKVVSVHPSGHTFTIPSNVASPTTSKSYLLATAAFAALAGAPPPDAIIPPNFLVAASDTSAKYNPYDTATWALGALPTNGTHSLTRTAAGSPLISAVNSPKNYAGIGGSVVAPVGGSASLPGIPDGATGSTPVLVSKLAADGSSLAIAWDTARCTCELDHQILYGQKSGLPGSPGGTYDVLGGGCNIGTASPFTWTPTPDASDGSGLVWFLVVAEDNTGREGSWGTYDAVNERSGPGTNGASNVCAVSDRDLSNACGH